MSTLLCDGVKIGLKVAITLQNIDEGRITIKADRSSGDAIYIAIDKDYVIYLNRVKPSLDYGIRGVAFLSAQATVLEFPSDPLGAPPINIINTTLYRWVCSALLNEIVYWNSRGRE